VALGWCAKENLGESLELASKADPTAVMNWVNDQLNPRVAITWNFISDLSAQPSYTPFGTCLPSTRIAAFGFRCILWNMLAIFLSLFLYLALVFCADPSEADEESHDRWWWSVGLIGCVLTFSMIIVSSVTFLLTLEYVIAIRYPLPQEHALWAMWAMDTFFGFSLKAFPAITLGIMVVLKILTLLNHDDIYSRTFPQTMTEDPEYPETCPTWTVHQAKLAKAGLDFDLVQNLSRVSRDVLLREELQNLGVPLCDRLRMILELQGHVEKKIKTRPEAAPVSESGSFQMSVGSPAAEPRDASLRFLASEVTLQHTTND